MPVRIEPVVQGGHRAIRLANGEADLCVSADMGPRILRFGFSGSPNFFKEMAPEEELELTGEQGWKVHGGHRVWVGPERPSYTYAPDNDPPCIATGDNWLRATSPADVAGIEKEIEV